MKRRGALLTSILVMAMSAAPANACRIWSPQFALSLTHDALPERLSPDLIVAEVDFGTPHIDDNALYTSGVRANVLRVIQGPRRSAIIVQKRLGNDELRVVCYRTRGGAGLFVGRPRGFENGVLVVEPMMVSTAMNYRLPDPQ